MSNQRTIHECNATNDSLSPRPNAYHNYNLTIQSNPVLGRSTPLNLGTTDHSTDDITRKHVECIEVDLTRRSAR